MEQVHAVIESVLPAVDTRSRFTVAANADPTLQLEKEVMLKGWLEHKRNCRTPAKQYWNVREDLTFTDGLVLKGEAVVVPSSLTKKSSARYTTAILARSNA